MLFTVPDPNEGDFPSLGKQVCKWIEANLVFGPGDLRGEPAVLDTEKQGLIWKFYEVYPRGAKDVNGKLIEGRRRFRRCAVSLQKGSAKTELAAWIAAAELHPGAPVRFDRWGYDGKPQGRGVIDPYIPMVAYTEEQADDLAYSALRVILELSKVADDFDIGLERIVRKKDGGKAVALAGSPNSRDGARTTFQHIDESHRWNLERLRKAATTMRQNLTKRPMAEPWELETTTTYTPGENSVAEQTRAYADSIAEGKHRDPRLFFYHRQASDGYDLTDPPQLRAAVVEAAGAMAEWKDIDGICDQWQDPEADKVYLERVYLNRPIATEAQAFSAKAWRENARSDYVVKPGAKIAVGFDGSISEDATALVATELETGFQWPLGIWEKPDRVADWTVPKPEVDAAVRAAFEHYEVVLMYADPSKWDSWIADWAGEFGSKRVVAWPTNSFRKTATGLRAYAVAIDSGDVTNDGSVTFARHIGNAQKRLQNFLDDDGVPLWLIEKDRPHSPNKIDAAMAGMLSYRAMLDAIANGALAAGPEPAVYVW